MDGPRIATLAAASILLVGAEAARGSRRFGGDDGGFVPPNRTVATCEERVARLLARDAACLDRCTFSAARATFFKGAPFDDEPCEQACSAAFVRSATALFAKNTCPPCITRFPPALVASINERSTDAATALVACAGTIPLGDDDGGFVAPDRATGKCELAVGKAVSKLDQAIIACHLRAADAALKGRNFDEEACEDAAERRYDAAVGRLNACPPCLDPAALATQVRANADAGNALIYCASPSGAFVDPPGDEPAGYATARAASPT